MGKMTWKRETDEPLEARFGIQVSRQTLAELKRRAGARGISAAELARRYILEGLDRADDPTTDA